MKHFLIFLLSFLFSFQLVMACSFIPDSFCKTAAEFSDHIIVSGYISSVDEDGINFEIIKIIRGDETRVNIRIWDGTDFDCNGLHSMAASDFGKVNDSLILILPKIDSLENNWDVLGDYRRPNDYTQSPLLTLQNNEVRGFIQGDVFAPPEYNLFTLPYDLFSDSWLEQNDCTGISTTNESINEPDFSIFPNPSADRIFLSSNKNFNAIDVRIFDQQGMEVMTVKKAQDQTSLLIDSLIPGLYYLRLEDKNNILATRRFTKL